MKSYIFIPFILIIFLFLVYPTHVTSAEHASFFSSENKFHIEVFPNSTPLRFVVVEKKNQKLKLYEFKDSLHLLKDFICSTGENKGHKKQSGDSRTPEGVYHITEIYEDKRVTVFGSRAFHLDYPNAFDVQAGNRGDGIFIHGTNKKLLPNSTNGCITLKNSDLDELSPFLDINTTPILIFGENEEFSPEYVQRIAKDTTAYRNYLDKLTIPFEKNASETISSLSYIKYDDNVIISASYILSDDKITQFTENKRVFLSQLGNTGWRTIFSVQYQNASPRILAIHPLKKLEQQDKIKETSQDTTKEPAKSVAENIKSPVTLAKHPLPMAKLPSLQTKDVKAVNYKALPDKGEEILNFLERWRSAWANKDIETYMSCYSPSFKNGNLDKEGWRARKNFLNQKYNFINVSIKNVVIEWTGSGAQVTFHQTYRSDQLQNSGKKTLYLVNKKSRWLIENEVI